MNDNIYDNINETLSLIEQLNIPRKFKGDQLYALEFNDVVDKINEIKNHLNGPVHEVMVNTTSYILDKIDKVNIALSADKIPLVDGSPKTVLDELNSIQTMLDATNSQITSNSTSIEDILSNLNSIGDTLGIHTDKIEEIENELNNVDDKITLSYNNAVATAKDYADSSYNNAVATAKDYADSSYNNAVNAAKDYADSSYNNAVAAAKDYADSSYNKAVAAAKDHTDSSYERLYTHINDTTLTFEYDVRTEPNPPQEKIIYDNNDDLYDGEYHD